MGSSARDITLSRRDDDRWVASDAETGTTSEGPSAGVALLGLGIKLGLMEDDDWTVEGLLEDLVDEFDESRLGTKAELWALSERVQRRFDEENVTEEDVEDAIEWARSQ